MTNTAFLLMDYQNDILANFKTGLDELLSNASKALQAARAAKHLVIHVEIGFRPGYPEVSGNNKMFGMLSQSGRFVNGTAGAQVHEKVKPIETDLHVIKHRISGFSGSDLEMILRAQNIDTLVLAGVATSGVVLSTLRQAADLDYKIFVLDDCCADSDEEVHRVLLTKLFPKQATVLKSQEMMQQWKT
jgi:nicotinamidase-related amidase